MKLDPVHDLQSVFRKIMRAASFPGEIVDLEPECGRLAAGLPVSREILLIALTLLDAETGFCFASGHSEECETLVSRMTFARRREPGEADFIFISSDCPFGVRVLEAARTGTLADPHRGATVVLELPFITPAVDSGGHEVLTFSGPGIRTSRRMKAGGDLSWVDTRAVKNAEYPLGIDMILIDGNGRLAFAPRTTRIERGG